MTDLHASARMVRQLNSEWELLRWTPADWLPERPTLNSLLEGVRDDADQTLGSLIMACQLGSATAGRVVVQAVLPKLILLSRSFPYPGVDHLVPAVWVRIARYSLDRRPQSIVANLVLDARKDVLAESRGVLVVAPTPIDMSFTARDVVDLARTLGLATEKSLAIVESVYVHGLPHEHVAQLYGLSNAAVRRRCSDTLRRLRAHRDLLADLLLP